MLPASNYLYVLFPSLPTPLFGPLCAYAHLASSYRPAVDTRWIYSYYHFNPLAKQSPCHTMLNCFGHTVDPPSLTFNHGKRWTPWNLT